MKQYRIRCIATGEWIRTRSGKSTWSTAGAAKGAYNISGTWVRGGWHHSGKFDDQSVLEIVEFTLCEAGVLEEAQQTVKAAVSFLEEILENHTPWNLEFRRKIEAFIEDNK